MPFQELTAWTEALKVVPFVFTDTTVQTGVGFTVQYKGFTPGSCVAVQTLTSIAPGLQLEERQ